MNCLTSEIHVSVNNANSIYWKGDKTHMNGDSNKRNVWSDFTERFRRATERYTESATFETFSS